MHDPGDSASKLVSRGLVRLIMLNGVQMISFTSDVLKVMLRCSLGGMLMMLPRSIMTDGSPSAGAQNDCNSVDNVNTMDYYSK